MKAAWYTEQGSADNVFNIGEMATPIPNPDEVLVKIVASGINPSDVKLRLGRRGIMEYPKIIPHSDGAGVIVAVGSNVSSAKIGQRVWVYNAQWQRPFGTAAEFVSVPEHLAIKLPDNVDFSLGACLGIPAFTAHQAVLADGCVKDKVVLVTGGAGSVGSFAIQIAKWSGATVIVTVSDAEKAAVAKNFGADLIINYKCEDVIKRILEFTNGVDRVVEVDFGGNLATNEAILKNNGVIASYASMGNQNPSLPFYSLMFKNITMRLIYIYDLAGDLRENAINDLSKMLEQNAISAIIAKQFALNDIVAAHKCVEEGKTIGNVIIDKF